MDQEKRIEFKRTLSSYSDAEIREKILMKIWGSEKEKLAEAELEKRKQKADAERQNHQDKRDLKRLKLEEEAIKIAKGANTRATWAIVIALLGFVCSVISLILT